MSYFSISVFVCVFVCVCVCVSFYGPSREMMNNEMCLLNPNAPEMNGHFFKKSDFNIGPLTTTVDLDLTVPKKRSYPKEYTCDL